MEGWFPPKQTRGPVATLAQLRQTKQCVETGKFGWQFTNGWTELCLRWDYGWRITSDFIGTKF
jgi:hypothetical protein